MPVDAHVFATFDTPMAELAPQTLSEDLTEAVGPTRFVAYYLGEGALQVVPANNYDVELPEGLPHAVCVLRVRLDTPYYGPSYERGYWPEIAAVLEFLRRRLPGARVWYGRDDGDWVKVVTAESLDDLWAHWAAFGGRPYHQRTKSAPTSEPDKQRPSC